MPPGGWYRMHRGWMENGAFSREPFTDREAFLWSVENAAWMDHVIMFNGQLVEVKRGQIITSLRRLGDTFGWSIKRVRSYCKRLEKAEIWAQSGTRKWARITICNYEKYQQQGHSEGNSDGQSRGTVGAQSGHTIEEGKEGKEGEETKNLGGADYAFFGQTIRLVPRHLDEWTRTFHAIPDIMAELATLDGWWGNQPAERRKGWFQPTKGMLNKKHQEILERRLAPKDDYDRDRIVV